MPDHIDKSEDIAAALLRLAGDDLAVARRELSGEGEDGERIHGARQRLKRVRTVLRVFEVAPGDAPRTVRRSLTATAQLLAGARDADVVAASARELAATIPRANELGFDRVASTLEADAIRAHQEKPPLDEIDRRLAALAEDIAALRNNSFDGRALLDKGFERAYRRGRRWMRRARSTLGTPELHDWRKNAKDLWHLMRLAGKRIGRKGQKLEPALERLSDLLGLDHDHAVLAEKLALSPTGDLALMEQLALIADRRRELEAEAFELGDSIYDEPPKAFARALALR